MAHGYSRKPVTLGAQSSNPFDIQHAPWKPLVKHQRNSAAARAQEIHALHTRALTLLKRATKILDKREEEKPRDMSRESYGRQVAWRRSSFGSTIGVQRMDPVIDIRPPRDCFTATQAHRLLELVTSVADTHYQKHEERAIDPRKPRTKKAETIPPPVLLPPFTLHIKQRPLPKSYYLEGSLRGRRETQRLKEKKNVKAEKPERESSFVAGRGIRYDGSRSADIPEGMGYQSARRNVIVQLDEYNRSYQAKRELSHRASEIMKEKRRARASLLAEKERHSLQLKASIEIARRTSQLTILRATNMSLLGGKK